MSTATFRLVRIARRGADAAFAAADWETFLGHQNTIIEFSRDPDEVVAAYIAKGDVLDRRLGSWERASGHYRKALGFVPRHVGLLLRVGRLEFAQGRAETAEALADRAHRYAVTPQDRRYATLLKRLAQAKAPIPALTLTKGIVASLGDGPELKAFQEACPDDEMPLADVVEAFAVCLID